MRVHLARVHRAARPHEVEQRQLALAAALRRAARVHQPRHLAGDEAVVDEDVLFDAERLVLAFEIAGAISGDAMAQRQVLRARGCANRIGLHEAKGVEGAREGRRPEQAARDREAAEISESQGRGDLRISGSEDLRI